MVGGGAGRGAGNRGYSSGPMPCKDTTHTSDIVKMPSLHRDFSVYTNSVVFNRRIVNNSSIVSSNI